jgi:hypothetical protein
MYDALLFISLFALLFSPYALNAWCDWKDRRKEQHRLPSARLFLVEETR